MEYLERYQKWCAAPLTVQERETLRAMEKDEDLSLIHISEPTRPY